MTPELQNIFCSHVTSIKSLKFDGRGGCSFNYDEYNNTLMDLKPIITLEELKLNH